MLKYSLLNKVTKTITSMHMDDRVKAQIINEVYKKPRDRKPAILDLILDPAFNIDNFVVYESQVNKYCIIGIRGTASISDVITDVRLVIQQLTNINVMDIGGRFRKIQELVLKVYNKYHPQGYTLTLAGHSLSGYEVMRLEKKNPDRYSYNTAFNAGSVPISLISEEDNIHNKIPDDVVHIRNPLDPISLGFMDDPNTLNIYKNKLSILNPIRNHGIEYFL